MTKWDWFRVLAVGSGLLCATAIAQEAKPAPARSADQSVEKDAKSNHAYSGMYTFTREGEFVQLTVEDDGSVTGFVSRFGDGESDKGAFLDQFFKSARLEGSKLSFTTEIVHAVWFEFKGTIERGEGKNSGDEAYFVLKGTLIENSSDLDKKVTSHSREVQLKLFPQEASPVPVSRK